MIAVILAYEEGKQIQYRSRLMDSEEWEDVTGAPIWSFNSDDYRIKPEPREWLLVSGGFGSPLMAYPVLANRMQAGAIKVREVLE